MRREPDFDESADMRLVDLQRAALGVPKPERGSWDSRQATEGAAVDAEGPTAILGAQLALDLTATPDSGVIPGAVVTLALSVSNDGARPAANVRVGVPLPGGAAYRNGSLVRDGRPVLDEMAEALFGDGLALGTLAAGTRATLVWKIGVRLGNKPLMITPAALAEETAVIGARALRITRKDGANAAFTAEVQRVERDLPIYELDQEEEIEHEAAFAALSPAGEYKMPAEAPLPTTPPPAQPEPLPPPDQPAPDFEPGVPDPEPSMPEPPAQPPDMEPAAREAVVLCGRLDRASVAYFDRIFNGSKPPSLLSHFILGGALACTAPQDGTPDAALDAHMQAQSQLLQRAVLHEKLGRKEPIEQYTGTMLARVDAFKPAPVNAAGPPADPALLLLQTELEVPALALLKKMQSESARWDFTKARQLTLALQAKRVIARAGADRIEAAQSALQNYSQVAGTQLQRFFVRMRLDRTTGLLFTSDETLDAAARKLLAALAAVF